MKIWDFLCMFSKHFSVLCIFLEIVFDFWCVSYFFSYRADFPTQQKQIACKYYERKKLRIFDDYLSIICSNLTKKFFLVQAICHLLVTTEISYELLRIFTHAKECFISKNSHIYKYTVIHPQKKHEKKIKLRDLERKFSV